MYTIKIDYFDFKRIMESGQVFRFYEPEQGKYVVYSGNRRLELRQNGNEVTFLCSKAEYDEYWETYFDLKRDYGKVIKLAAENCNDQADRGKLFLKEAAAYSAGIRILKQDVWEMMISFIISQQKQIPSIRKCIEALCARFGENHGDWYGFPTAKAIASSGPDGLKGLSLGYRERYIYETSVKYLADGFCGDSLAEMSYEAAKKYLCTFSGIGEKVADCVCLFGGGFTDAFPIDVHIKDILYREFLSDSEKKKVEDDLKKRLGTKDIPRKKLLDSISYNGYQEIIDKAFSPYKGVRGIVQQWVFAFETSDRAHI
ncbi:MAG: 8-oxoguanine DNA glycosylase [Lachnospiraceae bacterium]|nr:8-oxoguanine DNA glycosylase [Lachnospiraceae bacterium]